ncbi:putative DNA primase/helicase [Fimbriiglobus ruber]|uniref:Putative DNA primase/helicase n=1 Tax=Fimbriiglobus ruber TaxID=1908690 RepID=A0A225D015_9BACT|nr:putative DNA primase/helicase [Fimbriiglobus ruber]
MCNHLAFWFGKDPARMDAMFRRSGLMREKWERDDYRAATIGKAIEGTPNVYDPNFGRRVGIRFGTNPGPGPGVTSGFSPPRSWDDPTRLAEDYLSGRCVRVVIDKCYLYRVDSDKPERNDCWEPVSDAWMQSDMWQLCVAAALQEWERKEAKRVADNEKAAQDAEENGEEAKQKKPEVVPPVFPAMVNSALLDTKSQSRLFDDTKLGTWIDGDPNAPHPVRVGNGLLDLKTRELKKHSPAWFSTTKIPAIYDPKEPYPVKVLDLLKYVFDGDDTRISVFQECLGACLSSKLIWKHFTAFEGDGDSGKSTLLNLILLFLGERNCSTISLKKLTTEKFAAFDMYGKAANLSADEAYFESADEGRLRELTGGDWVYWEEKFKSGFKGRNITKIFFSCNRMPKFSDKSNAIWNRLILFPCENVIPADKKDPIYMTPEFWEGSQSGLLNFALDGLDRYLSNRRITFSPKIVLAGERHRSASDSARMYLQDNFVEKDHARVATHLIYADYLDWLAVNGYKGQLESNMFGKEIPQLFKSAKSQTRDGVRCWIGITQTTSKEDLDFRRNIHPTNKERARQRENDSRGHTSYGQAYARLVEGNN